MCDVYYLLVVIRLTRTYCQHMQGMPATKQPQTSTPLMG